jgi:hypothetical protein
MNRKGLLCGVLVLLLAFAFVPFVAAQTAATGALSGTVSDQSGALVPNVVVTATSADTGQVRTGTTGVDGTYKFGLLPPGSYRVRFQATGFKVVEIPSVTVTVTETQVLDSRLEVGTQTQEITVQGEAEAVQTASATLGTVVAGENITALPLTTRNYTNLLGLSAGANVGVFNASTLGKGTQDIAVNGATVLQNNFLMDGVAIDIFSGTGSAVDQSANGGIGVANPDAIQEFKIQTSQYDAGYGRNPGANVDVVTKSGTNSYHGSAFEFFRNTVLDANDFFRKSSPPVNGVPNNSRQVLNENQFGGVFGGPIKKNKIFGFAAYQESRQKNGIASAGYEAPTLPPFPLGDRSNTAAFQAAVGAAFCPSNATTGGKTGVNSATSVEVACNGSNINPVAINLLQQKNPDGSYLIPSSSNGLYQNTTFSTPAQFAEHQAIGNMDFVANSKNTLALRWFFDQVGTLAPFNCAATAGAVPGVCLPDTGANIQFRNQDVILKLTTIATNNLVNEARVSLQRDRTHLRNANPFTDTQFGIAPLVPQIPFLDTVTVSGLFTVGSLTSYQNDKEVTSWEFADQVSWQHGKQTIRAGLEYERDRENWQYPGLAIGTLTFQTVQDFLLGLPGCPPGNSACLTSPLPGTNGTTSSNISQSGTVTTVTAPGGIIHAFRMPDVSAFVQDDVKLKPRLTVNLGMRWEYDGEFFSDKYGDNTNVWPGLINTVPIPGPTPATGTLAGYVVPSNFNFAANPAPPVGGLFQSNHLYPTQNSPPLTNFAPRVGFAWQPLTGGKFVVRGGYGYFYDRVGLNNLLKGEVQGKPYSVTVAQSGTANYFSSFAFPYGNPSPTLGWTPRWVNINTTAQTGTSSNLVEELMEQNYRTPLMQQWNLNIQYEFAPQWVLELGYVGSHGIHQYQVGPAGAGTDRNLNEAQLASPSNPINGLTMNTAANASLRVPYLGFAPAGLSSENTDGDTKFNSAQATIRKQLSHGLQMQAAYTYSRSFSNTNTSNDPNNLRQQYGLSPSYRPNRLALSYVYELPFGTHDGFVGKVASGWSLSGVTVIQDGTPLTITDTRGGTVYGFGPGSPIVSRAQFAAGMNATNVATSGGVESRLGGLFGGQGYFNKAAFGLTPILGSDNKATGYGNSGPSIILGPGQFNWDATLQKVTKVGGIREGADLVFRAEFFNVFNHPQFNNPQVVDFSKSNFGQITSTSVNPRLVQLALKYVF